MKSQMSWWTLTSMPWKHKKMQAAATSTSTLTMIYITDIQLKCEAEVREMYPESFSGVGKFNNFEYHVNTDKNVKPVLHA